MKSFKLFIIFLFVPLNVWAQTVSDFSLETLEGSSFELNQVLGKKTIVINFWASWCKPCRKETPLLNDLKAKSSSKDVVFLGINAGESVDKVKKFVDLTGFTFTILLDPEAKVADQNKIYSLPHFLVISKEKKVVYKGTQPPLDMDFTPLSNQP